MKEEGFTLIELLAIIVILAIIAVITIPQIMNVVEDSKKSATKDSAYGYKNAVHQYYLTNSSNDDEFDLNGSYDVIDGTLSDGLNSYNISLTNDVPKSGSIIIEDGEIVDGCIDYGNYSVVIENGNVAEAVSGDCYNISYFTYDENAAEGGNGNITSKLSSPNSSWTYYIKEYEYTNKYLYGIWDKEDEEFSIISSENGFISLIECQKYFDLNYTAPDDPVYLECRPQEPYKTYQVCAVEDGEVYCLGSVKSNYDNNVDILNNIYGDCSSGPQSSSYLSYSCNDANVNTTADFSEFVWTSNIYNCGVATSFSSDYSRISNLGICEFGGQIGDDESSGGR